VGSVENAAQPDPGKQAKAETAGEIPRDAVLAALDSLVAARRLAKPSGRPIPAVSGGNSSRRRRPSPKRERPGAEVFGRPASWDPRLDPVVRQEAARLRKRLARYYETGGAEAEVRIECRWEATCPCFGGAGGNRSPAIETEHAGHAPTGDGAGGCMRQPDLVLPAQSLRGALFSARIAGFHRVLPFTDLTAIQPTSTSPKV